MLMSRAAQRGGGGQRGPQNLQKGAPKRCNYKKKLFGTFLLYSFLISRSIVRTRGRYMSGKAHLMTYWWRIDVIHCGHRAKVGYLPASYPGANNVLKIATLQCFYIDQWLRWARARGCLGKTRETKRLAAGRRVYLKVEDREHRSRVESKSRE
jgi:hypothetical protein